MKSNCIKKIFYTPNYLLMPTVGIDICNDSIKYIEFKNKKGNLSIKNYGKVGIVSGSMKDGNILNKETIIKSLLSIRDKISSSVVSVSIPEEKTYIFNIRIPKVSSSEIRQILEFKIEENVPLKAEEFLFEYDIIEETKDKEELLINVVVIPKKVISEYSELFEKTGLYPIFFEAESKAIINSLICNLDNKTYLIVNIKSDSTVLSIISKRMVHMTSTISIGENNINELISREKDGESVEENSNVKNSSKDFNSLLNVFSVFKDEIEKFNSYWSSYEDRDKNNFSLKVDKILICGGSLFLSNFSEHISQNIDIPVSLANVWQNVFDLEKDLPEISFIDSLEYPVAIGLSLISHKNNA